MKRLVLLLLVSLATVEVSLAQVRVGTEGELVRLTLKDGSRIIGQVESLDSVEVSLFTSYFGVIEVPQKDITSVKYLSSPRPSTGDYILPNPNSSRHFFSPTAIPLQKHEGYYQNFYIAFNMLNFGVTDHLSLGIASVPFTWFLDNGFNLAGTAKYSFKIGENWHTGAGFIVGNIASTVVGGIGYGLVTYGNTDNNITFGSGYGFVITDYKESEYRNEEESMVWNIAAMFRTTEHFALVTENWWFSDQDLLLLSYGGRYIGDRLSIDFGFINNKDIIEVIPLGIPLLGVVIYL